MKPVDRLSSVFWVSNRLLFKGYRLKGMGPEVLKIY
jgi:hypothetical protein